MCILLFLLTGYSEKYFKKLAGKREMEDSLERLDILTQEEARMASAELLKMTHVVDDRVRIVEGRVQDVRGDVQDVRGDVKDVGDKVQNVDGKLEQANRSLSLQILAIVLWAQAALQETSSEIIFYDGSRPPIHPPIITSHAKPITTAHLNGFFKEVYSVDGNRLAPYCGYMGNVRYSQHYRVNA